MECKRVQINVAVHFVTVLIRVLHASLPGTRNTRIADVTNTFLPFVVDLPPRLDRHYPQAGPCS